MTPSSTDTVPTNNDDGEADNDDEPAADPAVATDGILSVNSELKPEEWSFKDDELDETAWAIDAGTSSSNHTSADAPRLSGFPLLNPNKSTSAPCTKPLTRRKSRSSTSRAAPTASSSSKGTLNLPKAVQAMLDAIPLHAIPVSATPRRLRQQLTIADTGATDHMFPDRLAFISYHHSTHIHVCLGNNTHTPVLGTGMVIVSLNGKRILVRNTLQCLCYDAHCTTCPYTSHRGM